MPIRTVFLWLALAILFISGCSKSEDEEIQAASESAEDVFNDDGKVETNHSIDTFSFYLPNNMEVVEEDENNVVLENGDNTYVVFYNSLEQPASKLHYNAAKKENALLKGSFEDDDKFGFIRIFPAEGESYEMQVGVGGVKITTYTTLGKLDDEAETLMKIARSIIDAEENWN